MNPCLRLLRTSFLGVVVCLAVVLRPAVASATPILAAVSPGAISYQFDVDFNEFLNTGLGDVTAGVSNVANLGCDAGDFAGFAAGNIALISRGTCTFNQKATLAYAAGATGVLIYNNELGGALVNGTLGSSFNLPIIVFSTTRALGLDLARTQGLVMRMAISEADVVPEPSTWLLLGTGLAAVAVRRRFTKRT